MTGIYTGIIIEKLKYEKEPLPPFPFFVWTFQFVSYIHANPYYLWHLFQVQ